MPIEDSYAQGFTSLDYGETPDLKVMGEGLLKIVRQTNLTYASATARNAAIPAPVEGMRAWLRDADVETVYDGSSWTVKSKLLMPWTSLSSLGSYASGFSAASPTPRMRKVQEFGSDVWELEGRIVCTPALTPATTTLGFTLSEVVAHGLDQPSDGGSLVELRGSQ
ncbi:hypothetical protein AB0B51_34130 [Streptomyces griseus]|uniref:hypothetical protein n=1 Tax=Streptomyces griseus TaxID=1911 RepID=UPI0033E5B5D6